MDPVESHPELHSVNWMAAQLSVIPMGPEERNERYELLYLV